MYCAKCGKPVADGAKFCGSCGAPMGGGEPVRPAPEGWGAFFESLGSELLQVKGSSPDRYEFEGERKVKALLSRTTVRFQAVAVLDPAAKSMQWWDKVSESSFGLAPENFGVTVETRRQKGASVEIRKVVQTAGGGYAYHYGDLRAVVENEARQRGWAFKLVLSRPKG